MKKKLKNAGTVIMQGNVAMVEGAIAGGCKYFAGYPITPATEISEHASMRFPQEDAVFMQMEDELCSICSAIGAGLAGARAMTATSGPGFCLMSEGISYAIAAERPVVIGYISRGGPSGGQVAMPTQGDVMQCRYNSNGDFQSITLCPSSVQEMFDFTRRAFDLADKYMMPVIVLSDALMGHLTEKLIIPDEVELYDNTETGPVEEWYRPDENDLIPHVNFYQGSNGRWESGTHNYRGIANGANIQLGEQFVRHISAKVTRNIDDIVDVKTYYDEDMDIGIICYGTTARSVEEAVENLRLSGLKVGWMKVNTIWPLPEKQVKEFCSKAKRVIIPEMNMGQYVHEIERIVGNHKVLGISSLGGRIFTPLTIEKAVKEVAQ